MGRGRVGRGRAAMAAGFPGTAWTATGRAAAGKPAAGPLGAGEAVAVSGVREPSGVAYHAALRRLFVVGGDGSLVELDEAGRPVRSVTVGGNLEESVSAVTGTDSYSMDVK